MTAWMVRGFAAVRALLGLNDPSENRLHPSHGWLLPPYGAQPRRPLELKVALAAVQVSPASGKRR